MEVSINYKHILGALFSILFFIFIGLYTGYGEGKKAGNLEGKKELIISKVAEVNYDAEPCQITFQYVEPDGVTVQGLYPN